MTREEIVAGTLAWCNEIREKKGLEPLDDLPKGTRVNADSCPCGDATGLRVYMHLAYEKYVPYSLLKESEKYQTPPAVTTFVQMFDNGEFPEYDLNDHRFRSIF